MRENTCAHVKPRTHHHQDLCSTHAQLPCKEMRCALHVHGSNYSSASVNEQDLSIALASNDAAAQHLCHRLDVEACIKVALCCFQAPQPWSILHAPSANQDQAVEVLFCLTAVASCHATHMFPKPQHINQHFLSYTLLYTC